MIVYGSELAKKLKERLKAKIADLKGRRPKLAVILVGDDSASISYVKSKSKAALEVGIDFELIELAKDCDQKTIVSKIEALNADRSVDGILVQLPLPKAINEREVLNAIRPDKDVDGLTIANAGKLFLKEDGFVPCTPLGIMAILKEMGVEIAGKKACVIGRSNLVGLPVSRLLLNADATVVICHSKTQDLAAIAKEADILIVAIGKPRFIDSSYVKEGAYVVDVGINRVDGKLCGDVDFEDVKDKVCAITPVPKGVGPMTVCMLLENVYKAYKGHEVANDQRL